MAESGEWAGVAIEKGSPGSLHRGSANRPKYSARQSPGRLPNASGPATCAIVVLRRNPVRSAPCSPRFRSSAGPACRRGPGLPALPGTRPSPPPSAPGYKETIVSASQEDQYHKRLGESRTFVTGCTPNRCGSATASVAPGRRLANGSRTQPWRGENFVGLRFGGDDVGPVPSPGGGSGGQKGMPGQGTRPTVSPSPPRTRWPLAPTSASAFRPAFRIPPWPRAAPPTREGERPRKPHRFQAIRIPHSPKCNHG